MSDLALPNKSNKYNNQSGSEFDKEVSYWKENNKTVFIRIFKLEEGKKNLYSLFTYQCEPSLKTKLKRTKGYDKAHNMQDGIKLMELIRIIVCVVESHLHVNWSTMKTYKHL